MNTVALRSLAAAAVTSGLLITVGTTVAPATGVMAGRSEAMSVGVAPVQVRLITGDLVSLTRYADGRQAASVASPRHAGPGSMYRMFSLGPEMYVVPESAIPYIGTTLSLSLFDVSALAQHPATSLQVRLALRPGAGRASLPGATVHRTGATTATATFTPTSALTFGRALARQFARDDTSPTHTTGLFAAVAKITPLPAATAAPPISAKTGKVTLTIHATDQDGNPDTGDSATLLNVADQSIYSKFLTFTDGQAQVHVPPGRYSLLTYFAESASATYQVALPQFAVRKDKTISIDARRAKTVVHVAVPRKASPHVSEIETARTDAQGDTATSLVLVPFTTTFKVQPTRTPPTVGSFHYFVYYRLFSPPTAKQPYTYDVKFPSEGLVPADESFTATPASLARIRAGYAAGHEHQRSLDTRVSALPWEDFLFVGDLPFRTPTQRTEYYTARPDLSWSAIDYAVFHAKPFVLQGEIDTSWRAYAPGPMAAETYHGHPAHPRLLQQPIDVNPTVTICPVCVSSSALDVLAFPFSDNDAGHRSYPDRHATRLTESEAWAVKADGTVVKSGTGVLQTSAPLVKGTREYAVSYRLTRSSPNFSLSTKTSTTWSFDAKAPEAALPAGWVCNRHGSTDCTVPPVMTSSYALPVDLLGQITSGKTRAEVTIGHLAGSSEVPVTTFTAEVSFDGTTWKDVNVTDDGSGHYTLSFTVPAKGQTNGYGSLRIHATDGYGDTLAETIMRAFAVE